MGPEFVIAILLCHGQTCDLVQVEPEVSYATEQQCNAAATAKAATLSEMAERQATGRATQVLCVRAMHTIAEVEEPHEVLDTAIAHTEPNASSAFVGIVERGTRVLVTGHVAGTQWDRVLLADGQTGFVYADRLRKIGSNKTAAAQPAPSTSAAPAPPSPPPPATNAPAAPPTASAPPPVNPPLVKESAAAPSVPKTSQPPQTSPAPSPKHEPQLAMLQQHPPTAASPPSPTLTPAGEFHDCPNCPVMLPVPAGTFTMGSNDDPSERPVHRVTIHAFALGKYEVTAAEWDACASAGACAYHPPLTDHASEKPMTNLSWDDAAQYLQWLRKLTGKPYRFPTESEWEYAARAGSVSRFAWGAQPAEGHANCTGCGGVQDPHHPAPVGAFPPNPWGFYAMEGGVAEWVEDCWHPFYQGAPTDGSAWRATLCPQHVLRGGSWKNPPPDITVSSRNFYDADVRYPANGFRVALTR
jgi:formylglycine-generating enzyme required for sulfatase activity